MRGLRAFADGYISLLLPIYLRALGLSPCMTSVPSSLAAALSPMLTGYLLSMTTFGWFPIAAGTMKIVCDLLLYAMFRNIRPPEKETGSARQTG